MGEETVVQSGRGGGVASVGGAAESGKTSVTVSVVASREGA